MHSYSLAERITDDIAQELSSYPPVIQQLLFQRKIFNKEDARSFLNHDFENGLHDPYLLNDMDKAVVKIIEAIKNKDKIAIFSDYDCDGIPGGVLFHDFLKCIGYNNFFNHIPHRHDDGFGLGTDAVRKLHEKGASLIITVDCGTTSHKAVDLAVQRNIDVIITDHHEPGRTLPAATAVVNPKVGNTYPFQGLCGSAVIFKLVQAIIKHTDFGITKGREKWWLDLVGIATIADMVPLLDENRILAHYGLLVLRKSRRPGLQQLLRKVYANQRHLTEDDIGFTIGPRINAASRMDTPEIAFRLLATDNKSEAQKCTVQLEALNNKRRTEVSLITRELHKRIKATPVLQSVIVMGDSSWRPSLVGLAANSLAEELSRPVFIWGRDGRGLIKGSCRSDGRVSVHKLMSNIEEVFLEYGGHHVSGGFSISDQAIHSLPRILSEAHDRLTNNNNEEISPSVIDFDVSLNEVNHSLIQDLKKFAPYGKDNPKPVFRINEVRLKSIEIFGKTKNHTRLHFESSGLIQEAIAFFKKPSHFAMNFEGQGVINIIGHIETSYFMGRHTSYIRVIDIT